MDTRQHRRSGGDEMRADTSSWLVALPRRRSCPGTRTSGAMLLFVGLLSGGVAHAADAEGCGLSVDADDAIAADLRWERVADRLTLLADDVPTELSYTVEYQASLGSLAFTWIEGPFAASNGQLSVVPSPPAHSFLDALATDYVTDVAVRVRGTDQRRLGFLADAPPMWMGWPDGRQAGPELWDAVGVLSAAPNGVLDEALRASFGLEDHTTRVLPPTPAPNAPSRRELTICTRRTSDFAALWSRVVGDARDGLSGGRCDLRRDVLRSRRCGLQR